MYYKADSPSVSHHVTLERADLSCFTPLLYVDDNKSLSDAVPAKQRKSEVLGWTGDAHHDGGGKNDLWWQHFCFIYVFYNDQSPVLRDRVPFASIFSRIYPLDGGVALNNDLRCFRDARMYSHSLSLSLSRSTCIYVDETKV